jgi:hypothetical protein
MPQIRKLTFLPEEVNSNRSIKKQREKNNKLITISPRSLMVNPKFPWKKPNCVYWQQVLEYIEKIPPQPDRYNK